MASTTVRAAFAALAAFACGDSTGPAENYDPVAVAAVVSGVLDAALENEAVRSLAVVGSKIRTPPTGAPNRSFDGQRAIPILEPVLGRRLVYNKETEEYEFAADAGSAPQNGVRFELYMVNVAELSLVMPLDPLGPLDVMDESSNGSQRIGVLVSRDEERLVDYSATATGNILVATLAHNVDGFVAAGTGRIELDLAQRISQSEGIELDYSVIRDRDAIRVELDFDAQTLRATTTLTVASGGAVFSMTTSGTPTSIEGTVQSDGSEVARIDGSAAVPVFTDTNGVPLVGSDLNALRTLFDSPDRLFEIIDYTLAPSYWVFGLSLIFQR